MSLLPFLTILIHILVGFAQAGPDFKGAEALMQIQRVLDLSAEIAKAEEVTVSDISTAESKYTKKRQYAVPDDLLRLVGNTITDLKSQQASSASESAESGSYGTASSDIRLQGEDTGNYAIVPYSSQQQREQQHSGSVQAEPTHQYSLQQSPIRYALPQELSQQYALPPEQLSQYTLQPGQIPQYSLQQSQASHYSLHPSQGQQYTLSSSQGHYAPSQGQQYTLQHEQVQQYVLQPGQNQQSAPLQSYQHQHQYSLPPSSHYQIVKQPLAAYSPGSVAHSYVTTYPSPSPPSSPPLAEIAQVATPQKQTYPPSAYQTDPNHHYTIAAQQAQSVAQHKPQQHMYYVGGHPQTGTYTEAVIHGQNPSGLYVPQPASQLTVPKGPLQINIHSQPYSLVSSYQNSQSPGQSSYMPLQILINHLAEPVKYNRPGISAPGGPDQPKMPIYHYSPVPVGTIKDEHVPEMRIKSTNSPPNPHSDKYKDYPSSPPATVSSSLAMPPSSSFVMSSTQSDDAPPQQPLKSSQPNWDDEEFIKYDFGYRVSDEDHKLEFGKTESKKDGVTKGSYHVLLPDGRLQVVKYWSDHTGYHTDISYKVPGVDGK